MAARGAIEGERKRVTVLFCDIVRSSGLALELGPERFHEVIDRFFRVALAEVHRYGGTINQFLGDGFMALFGAPIAHEDHARRAVLAALGITERAEVSIRIGINSGPVVVGAIGDDLRVDYTAFGDTTVLAARLQAAAAPGAVLISKRTAKAVRGYFRLEELPPVQVKERTVTPVRVTGLGPRTSRIATGDVLSRFTGREGELSQLCRLLEVVAAGQGQVVGVAGDPGLGKSRLALEFRRLAEPDAAVREGRCLSYGAGIAYLPLFELVRDVCGFAVEDPPDVVAARIEAKIGALGLGTALARYLGHAFGVSTGDLGLDPQAIRAGTFDALRRLFVAEAERRPLVVLVEDLHWIDQTSEAFLAQFADELPSVPVMLLVTYRSGYAPPWIGKSFATQLALRPLSPAASEQIVNAILGTGDPGATTAIAARGDGNPFFLEELARASQDAGDRVAVPETVQQVLAARIDRLSADQKAAIQLAAVLGREFSLGLAEDVWDGGGPLEARLAELKGLEFLRERPGRAERTFVFRHALTREVAYDSMLEASRRVLHGRAGTALEDSPASQRFERAELLAYHFSRSGEPTRAIRYLADAGDRAKDRYANEEAVAAYRQAIELIEELNGGRPPEAYGAICESLGTVLVRLSRFDEALGAYRRGMTVTSDPFRTSRLLVLCAEADSGAHRYPEALAQCALAEQALGPAAPAPEPRWLSAWLAVQAQRMGILYWLNDVEDYARLIERVRPVVEAHGSAEQRASFFLNLLGLALRQDRYLVSDENLEIARAVAAAVRGSAASPLWWAVFNLGFALLWHGDLDEAEAVLRDSLAESERRGDATTRSRSLTYLMVVARMRGDVAGVRDAIATVIERAREASLPEYEAIAIANRAWVEWRTGDEQKAAADARAALDIWEKLPVRYFYDWMALWPLLAIALAAGRPGEAVEHARGMLPATQQKLQQPLRSLVEDAVQRWDAGQPAESEEVLRGAVEAATTLGYL
jgi:class 3 adenylate cyclase/tetratricopeptide (TPR) repeat protein